MVKSNWSKHHVQFIGDDKWTRAMNHMMFNDGESL